jgi:hypothetical protein
MKNERKWIEFANMDEKMLKWMKIMYEPTV